MEEVIPDVTNAGFNRPAVTLTMLRSEAGSNEGRHIGNGFPKQLKKDGASGPGAGGSGGGGGGGGGL